MEQLDVERADAIGWDDATGVILTDVAVGSAAERRGVAQFRNYKLVQINDSMIASPDDVRGALDGVEAGEIVSLHFEHPNGTQQVVNVRMP